MKDKKISFKLRKYLCFLAEELGVGGKVRIRTKRFKRKIATVSLTSRVIYINSDFLKLLTDEEIKYIIAHELLHLKYGVFHTPDFEKELSEVFGRDMYQKIADKFYNNYFHSQFPFKNEVCK